jgi:hypothetical protein
MPAQQESLNNPPLRPGIIFGPGRSTRIPESGTLEYQKMVERMRNITTQQK